MVKVGNYAFIGLGQGGIPPFWYKLVSKIIFIISGLKSLLYVQIR